MSSKVIVCVMAILVCVMLTSIAVIKFGMLHVNERLSAVATRQVGQQLAAAGITRLTPSKYFNFLTIERTSGEEWSINVPVDRRPVSRAVVIVKPQGQVQVLLPPDFDQSKESFDDVVQQVKFMADTAIGDMPNQASRQKQSVNNRLSWN